MKLNSIIKYFSVALLTAALSVACSRGGDGVPELDADIVATEDPNRFLLFLNEQVGLPAGNYKLVAATLNVGESGSFRITAEFDNGTKQTFDGAWTASGGMDETSADNPNIDFTMPYSGGVKFTINSQTQTCLYLLDSGDTVIAGQDGVDLCAAPATINMPRSKINLAANAAAYYDAIDPTGTRGTLDDWRTANSFGMPCGAIDPCEVNIVFRDTKDLGYGRNMFVRRNDDGSIAMYVENFQVDAIPGAQYSELNLDAAIQNERQWHFGTNAIEFSTYPYGVGEPRDGEVSFATVSTEAPLFAKFYTFRPDEPADPNTVERLLLTVDLDERGQKSMPGPCISCHGGKSRPLLVNGELPPSVPGGVPGDLQAQLQAVEVDTLGFSEDMGFTRSDLEAGLRFLNQAVLDSYRIVNEQYAGVDGYWNSDATAELLKGWYGGNTSDPLDYTLPNNDFDESYVPPGWRPNVNTGTPPPGVDILYKEVVGPNCIVCHSKRGTNKQDDIDFATYSKFIGHAAQIEDFVYDKGIMPLGLLNFDLFWDNSATGRAELLAGFLPEFSHSDAEGVTQQPGRPVAVAAVPGSANTPLILSAEGSSFADTYQWRIVDSPSGSAPTLDNVSSARPVFDTDMDGDYSIELMVSKGSEQSEAVTVDIAVDSVLTASADIRFDPDIRTVLQANPAGATCVSCHASGGEPGVPVYYTDAQVEGRVLYDEVISRVNFKEPVESELLRKPADNHHFGGLIGGFDLEGDRSNYDLFLTWILQGAPR